MKKVLLYTGLFIASIVATFYLFMIVGELFDGEGPILDFESLGFFIFDLLSVASVIIAWNKIQIGVWLVLGIGILFSIFGLITAGQNRWMAVIGAGGPLILGALLIALGNEVPYLWR